MSSYNHADEILRSSSSHPLFLGDIQSAQNLQFLNENHIKTVITAASGFKLQYDNNIRHIRYELQDKKEENIASFFDKAAMQIHRGLREGGVLVHCGAGVSRSTTLVIAYLIKYHGMTFLQALKMVKSKRPSVCPNLGFELQLKTYQKTHLLASNTFLLAPKKKQSTLANKQQLPNLIRWTRLQTTVYKAPFNPSSTSRICSGQPNLSMSKSLKPVQSKQKRQIEYLKKMAQFRFGITNMGKWPVSTTSTSYGHSWNHKNNSTFK